MKTSKKSLIVSIAVLCVCALSLTAASFAWFSASNTSKVENLQLQVAAQSDIKLSADAAARENAYSDAWKDTLTLADIQTQSSWKDIISDVTPTTLDTCDGTFKVPATRDSVDTETGAYSGELVATDSGFASFTVYVRTTSADKNVAFSTTGFTFTGTGSSAVAALRLGETKNQGVYTTASNQVVVETSDLTAIGDTGYYTGSVTFYIWVEGTDAACKNANALSVKDYKTTLNFSYAA